MAKAKWLGPGVLNLGKGKGKIQPGSEFDNSDLDVDRYNTLVDKGYIDGSKRNQTKASAKDGGAE